jgi:hypothetical protein
MRIELISTSTRERNVRVYFPRTSLSCGLIYDAAPVIITSTRDVTATIIIQLLLQQYTVMKGNYITLYLYKYISVRCDNNYIRFGCYNNILYRDA